MGLDSVWLDDRGVVAVVGPDAASLLQGLLTSDVESLAPGGSRYHSAIIAPDSNDADAESATFSDLVANDYTNLYGTSMAAPFAAGAAALVIDAFQQAGGAWDFGSSTTALRVKMLLGASAT